MADLEQFRAETRAWLEANCPAEMRTADARRKGPVLGRAAFRVPVARAEAMARRHGVARLDRARLAEGIWRRRALSPAETKVLKEEMQALGCRPPLTSFGISMLGPALLKYRQ